MFVFAFVSQQEKNKTTLAGARKLHLRSIYPSIHSTIHPYIKIVRLFIICHYHYSLKICTLYISTYLSLYLTTVSCFGLEIETIYKYEIC